MQRSSVLYLEMFQDYSPGLEPQDVSRESHRVSIRRLAELEESTLVTRIRISGIESRTVYQGRASPLKTLVEHVARLTFSQVRDLLLGYTDRNTLRIIEEVGEVNPWKLAALLLWISDEDRFGIYGKPVVDVVIDVETSEFQFISIVLPSCEADTWDDIVKGIKDEMRRAGLTDMVSKVAIVCLQGLQELLR